MAMVKAGEVIFEDFTGEVNEQIQSIIGNWLEEASSELASQAAKRTRRGTGETADKWTNLVDKNEMVAYVGNPLENAIWEEYGTGEYALNNDGRKGGWYYYDEKDGKFHHTYGKTPTRALHHAFNQNEAMLKEKLKADLGSMK